MYIYRGKINWYQYAENEGITVIFPTSPLPGEHGCAIWQWTKTPDGKPNRRFVGGGPIVGNTLTDEGEVLPPDSSTDFIIPLDQYKLHATLASDFTTLSVNLFKGGRMQGPTILNLVSRSDAPEAKRQFYAGKLNWSNASASAIDEMVVVASEVVDNRRSLHAFWQWTAVGDAVSKVNVDHVEKIEDVGSVVSTFKQENDDVFTIKEDEEHGGLLLMTKGADGEILSQTLGPLADKNTIINNFNPEEIFYCKLDESGTATIDKALAAIGIVIAVASVPFAFFPPTAPAAVGAIGAGIAISGLFPATAGIAHAFWEAGPEAFATLFLNDRLSREVRGPGSRNDVEIIRSKIENVELSNGRIRSYLLIRYGRRERLDAGAEYNASEVIPAADYTTILKFRLQNQKNALRTQGLLRFTFLKPLDAGVEVPDEMVTDGGIFTYTARKVYDHGALTTSREPLTPVFEYSPTVSPMALSYDKVVSRGSYILHRMSTQRQTVIRLVDYGFQGVWEVQDELGTVRTDQEVVDIIESQPTPSPYLAYYTFGDSTSPTRESTLRGVKPPLEGADPWKVVSTDATQAVRFSVWFVPQYEPMVFQTLVALP